METSVALLPSPWLMAAVAAIVVVAAIVQFGLGMGFGLTAAPLLALIDPALVPVPTLFLGMLTSAWGAWHERTAIRWDEIGVGFVGRLAGICAATGVLLLVADQRRFTLVFGVLVALAVVLSLAGRRLAFTRPNLIAMSAISGLMATITSVGAPPMALIYQDRPAQEARPTLAAFFALGCAAALAVLFATGWADSGDVVLAALMLPPMIAGLILARHLRGRFDKRYRPALLAVAGLAALLLIVRGLS